MTLWPVLLPRRFDEPAKQRVSLSVRRQFQQSNKAARIHPCQFVDTFAKFQTMAQFYGVYRSSMMQINKAKWIHFLKPILFKNYSLTGPFTQAFKWTRKTAGIFICETAVSTNQTKPQEFIPANSLTPLLNSKLWHNFMVYIDQAWCKLTKQSEFIF